jgi:CheY-like chemotaxis protein/HPt (histidine-containing phosphotransfer) domain-containing protein
LRPTVIASGREALAELEKAHRADNPYALVLLDGMMPEMDGFDLAGRIKEQPGLVGAALMMLSSADRKGDSARCRELGVSAYLVKPIRQSDLLDAIVTTLHAHGHGDQRPEEGTRPKTPLAEQPLKLLLAEDNPVNQRVAVGLLQKRGHHVTVVNSGREAVEAAAKQSFDAILMDLQMPEMDGFEATAAIRGRESSSGEHIPIIAMTAHAMKGDRELCFEAGMDGYVSKPLQARLLYAAIEQPREDDRPEESAHFRKGEAPAEPPAFDEGALLDHFGDDPELLNEVAGVFIETAPTWQSEIHAAVAAHDAVRLQRAAHTVKGAVSHFGAQHAYEAANQLEQIAKTGQLQNATAACATLERELRRLQIALQKHCSS